MREGRAAAAVVLRRMADNPDLEGASLSAEELQAVVGSPVSLEELEAAADRLDRLASFVPARVREDRRLAAAWRGELAVVDGGDWMDVEVPTCELCGSRMDWDDRIVAFVCPVCYTG